MIIQLPPVLSLKEDIEDVIDDQSVSITEGGCKKYLVMWGNHPLFYCTWIASKEFEWKNHELYGNIIPFFRWCLVLTNQEMMYNNIENIL